MSHQKRTSGPSLFTGNPSRLAALLVLIAGAFWCCENPALNEDDQSGSVKSQPKSDHQADADSLYRIAESYAIRQPDSALLLHKQVLEIRESLPGEDVRKVESYWAIASIYMRAFKYPSAESYLEKARIMGEKASIEPRFLIDIYFALANCKRNMKDVHIAISLQEKARDFAQQHFPDDRLLQARSYNLLAGTYYYDRKYDATIENAKKAIALVPRGNHQVLADIYTTLGIGYLDSKQYDRALESFDASIRHDLKWTSRDSAPLAIRYVNKAEVFSRLKNYDSARYYLHKNLRIRTKTFGEKNVNSFGAKYSLGQFFEQTGDYDSAVHYYQQSLISLIRDFNEPDWRFNPRPLEDELDIDLMIGLVGKGSALAKMSRGDAEHTSLSDHALAAYFLADSVFTAYRKNFTSDDPQLAQLEAGYIPYGDMVDLSLQLHDKLGDSQYLEHAFTIVEKSRSVLLQNALMRAEGFSKAGVPAALRDEEREILSNRQNILRHLKRNGGEARHDSLQRSLLALNDRHRLLLQKIQDVNPQYSAVRYMEGSADLGTMQAYLKKRTSVLIDFLWAGEYLYSLLINGDTIIAKKIPFTTEIDAAMKNVLSEMRDRSSNLYDRNRFTEFCSNSYFLYSTLLADIEKLRPSQTKNLIISADGPLQSFPFEALITSKPERQEVNYQLPYVFLKYPVTYSFSSNMLLRQSLVGRRGKRLLGFAYGNLEDGNTQFANLPGSELEISEIKKIVNSGVNRFYFNADATESAFKKEVPNFDIVHLAIHGLADTTNELESRLIFRGESDSVDDGQLYAHELYDLNLHNLDLAVLSACESGVGRQYRGEGVFSIARSFAYGGCASQVISLWRIDDRTTAELMSRFYIHLADGEDVSVALANAKRDYLAAANDLNSHPSFWAAFIQIGDARSVFNRPRLWLVWVGISLAVLVLAGLVYRRFRLVPPPVR